ncbi:MAG: LptA/OstA family protein [Pseudomonadota bacterium]|nr:LptA/OstA family protein [Pseudomonadota bacterium]
MSATAAFAACLLLVGACAPPEVDPPLPQPLPSAATASGVEVSGDGWSAAAATLRFGAGFAQATEPAVVRPSDGKPPLEIVAERSEWDLKARTARFVGAVHVRRGDVVMRCDALDVLYADAERIDRVIATGSVEVRRGERLATSASAELEGATGKVALTGEPRLSEGPNTLAGHTIVLWLDDERATCEGVSGAPCRLLVEGSALQ